MADGNSATVPVARLELDGYDWFARHAQILEIQSAVDPEIVLVGDSITHYWGSLPPQPQPTPANGPKAFASVFGARRVLNAGFGWDRTQNVLWRLMHLGYRQESVMALFEALPPYFTEVSHCERVSDDRMCSLLVECVPSL